MSITGALIQMIEEFGSSKVGRPLPSGNGRPKVGMEAMRQVMRRYYVEQLEEHFPLRLLRQGTYPPGQPARPQAAHPSSASAPRDHIVMAAR
jgi:hypothetical protein